MKPVAKILSVVAVVTASVLTAVLTIHYLNHHNTTAANTDKLNSLPDNKSPNFVKPALQPTSTTNSCLLGSNTSPRNDSSAMISEVPSEPIETFKCPACLDNFPLSDGLRPFTCDHPMCGECATRWAQNCVDGFENIIESTHEGQVVSEEIKVCPLFVCPTCRAGSN